MGWVRAETRAGSVAVDAAIGNLRELCFNVGDRRIAPLHTAHWVGNGRIPYDIPPVERDLSGDFFCAPFGTSDVEPGPPHGWSANSHWTVARQTVAEIDLTLDAPIMGARITKSIKIAGNAPILYQSHTLEGGQGELTVAHHPMVHLAGRARLSLSPKRAALTPAIPLEPGRNALACQARTEDIHAVPSPGGGTVDLTRLPIAKGCEDFVTLIEAQGAGIGWSAILREAEGDIVFFLKEARMLPVTMLWHSNGGRDYAPWGGRHTGVIGIEDGCAGGAGGHRAALAPNPVSQEGVPTALELGGRIEIRHAMGAVPCPEGWACVADIRVSGSKLTLIEESGAEIALPFDPGFFPEAS